jgi:hypothetical protein
MISKTTQPNQKQLAALVEIANTVIECHADQVRLIRVDLMDFDIPAQRSINAGFHRMGIDRFTPAGDDVWQMVFCLENTCEYERPERRLVDRWATY